jgi:hypothetical protein
MCDGKSDFQVLGGARAKTPLRDHRRRTIRRKTIAQCQHNGVSRRLNVTAIKQHCVVGNSFCGAVSLALFTLSAQNFPDCFWSMKNFFNSPAYREMQSALKSSNREIPVDCFYFFYQIELKNKLFKCVR